MNGSERSAERKLLILDLDSTLVWSHFIKKTDIHIITEHSTAIIHLKHHPPIRVNKRPFLGTFLNYCFDNYDVAVWSAGAKEYVHEICKLIFKDRPLIFIFSKDQCNSDKNGQTLKQLSQVWANKKWSANPENTLILDDTPETYSQNSENAVPISSYYGNEHDRELLKVIYLLKQLVLVTDVRKIVKTDY